MPRSSTLFHPSREPGPAAGTPNWPVWALAAFLAVLFIIAYLTIHVDHPLGISGKSRALYVDEGFYSDAAQNFTKFGRWSFPLDFPHWAGAPLLTFIQSVVFTVFSPTLETARLLSVAFSLVTALAFYYLARMGLSPLVAVLFTVSSVLTFNYAVHARSALADPVAVCFAMLALLIFARLRITRLSIPVSIGLAFLALLSKVYFVFVLATVAGLWLIELWLYPVFTGRPVQKRDLAILGMSLAAAGMLFAVFLQVFGEHLADYYSINANKIPFLDPVYLVDSLVGSLNALPYNTKTHVPLLIVAASVILAAAMLLHPRWRTLVLSRAARLSRAELAVCVWLIVGIVTIGVLQLKKPHYYFFAVLPLCLAGAVGLKLILPARFHAGAVSGAAALHLLFQAQFYHAWVERPDRTALYDASHEVARIVHQRTQPGMVPVIGEYSAQLGLFSERVFSLDAKWSPGYALCERVVHWTPRFHVNIVWPGSVSQRELSLIAGCRQVDRTEEIARFTVFTPSGDELVLSRIHYKN